MAIIRLTDKSVGNLHDRLKLSSIYMYIIDIMYRWYRYIVTCQLELRE